MYIASKTDIEQRVRKIHGEKAVTVFHNGQQCVAYGPSAATISSVCGQPLDGDCKLDRVVFLPTQLDFFLPKLVRDGFKVCVLDD